jgi:hypothetical protein
MRRRRFWPTFLGILLAVAASLIYAAWPGRSTFTVGSDTTYVTGPLDKRGYVDYGGRGLDDEPQGDDLSIRMPVPEPRRKE